MQDNLTLSYIEKRYFMWLLSMNKNYIINPENVDYFGILPPTDYEKNYSVYAVHKQLKNNESIINMGDFENYREATKYMEYLHSVISM